MIRLADYPHLRLLAWNRPVDAVLDDAEAFALFEANWRHIDHDALTAIEAELLQRLIKEQGAGVLLA
jgi:hypothetical protein